MDERVSFENVSRFYGEVLGVNRITLSIPPGITSLVGPNGSGKTTLMNLMTGLVRPTRGEIRVLGIAADDPERLCRGIGYATQFDSFPRGLTGYQFIYSFLRLFGFQDDRCRTLANAAIERVRMGEAAHRKVAGYSKGMRQRIRLAQAIAHDPRVLVLDEPLNGLDPLVRSETIALFRECAAQGRHVIVSSHVLHEVDQISDQVILLSNGYVVAEGQIQGVRGEIQEQPRADLDPLQPSGRPGLETVSAGSRGGSAIVGRRRRRADQDPRLGPLLPRAEPHCARRNRHRRRNAGRRRCELGIRILDRRRGGIPMIRQLTAVMRLELKKTFFSRRSLWIYLLAVRTRAALLDPRD